MNIKTKILITGGAGFIGSNLCEYFLSTNKHLVVCLDNLSTGHLKNIEKTQVLSVGGIKQKI